MDRAISGLLLFGIWACAAEPAASSRVAPSPPARSAAAETAVSTATTSASPTARGQLRFNRRTGLALHAVAWSADGKGLATWCGGSCDDTSDAARTRVLLWSLPELQIRAELEPNPEDMGEGRIYNAAWSADGSRIAVTTHNEVTLWRAEDASLVTRVSVPAVYGGIEFSPDGNHLAMTGVYGHVIVVDAASGRELLSDALHDGAASYSAGITWSADGSRLYAEGNASFGVFEPKRGGKKLRRLAALGGEEGWMTLSTDGKLLLLGASRTCLARVHAAGTLALVKRLEGKEGACRAALAPSGDRLAYVTANGSVRVTPLSGEGATTNVTSPIAEDEDRTPGALAFSPDGRRLVWAVGTQSGVWDFEKSAALAGPAAPIGHAVWESPSVLEVFRDDHKERFDVDKSVILATLEHALEPTPFEGLTARAEGDLTLRKSDGAELVVRAIHDGKWKVAMLDPRGRGAGSESLLASDAYDAARGAGAPFEVAPDLPSRFFAGLPLRPLR